MIKPGGMDKTLFLTLVGAWTLFGLLLFPLLLKVTAPYGRHARTSWGPMINNRLGWILMELPALLVFIAFFLAGNSSPNFLPWFFAGAWVMHYTNRSLVFPFRIRNGDRKMPVVVAAMAVFFNGVNASLNGWYLGQLASYPLPEWLSDPRFIIGLFLFLAGLALNWHSDGILIRLRKDLPTGSYRIPEGGGFRYVSCPNFLGEMIEWGGFALMSWSPAALSFFLWTLFNLVPRALDHHRWYRDRFSDYPRSRKALIPFLL